MTFILPHAEPKIHRYMFDQLRQCECIPRIINGTADHVHLLFLTNYKMPITDVLKQVKGSTSHWINSNRLSQGRFCWQDGFGAFSVSESQVEKVHQYILNQKQHHEKKSFNTEFEQLVIAHGMSLNADMRVVERGNC